MNGQPTGRRSARTRVAAAAACSVVVAVLGAAIVATPANASPLAVDTSGCSTTSPSGPLVSVGSTNGVVGIDPTATGSTIGVLGCTVTVGQPTPSASPSTPEPSASPTTTPTTAPVPSTETPSPEPSASTSTDQSTVAAESASSPVLADLSVVRGSPTVYPVKDGYLDTVKFAVRPSNAAGAGVAVLGTAEILKGSTVVKRWNIGPSERIATWNGRVGNKIEPGLYSFKVTAWSPDGTTRTSSTYIRVLSQHLVKQSLVIRKRVGGGIVADSIPKQLLKAYSMGRVSVRTRTDAIVHGPARLVFRGPGGTHVIPLRNGVHTTAASFVPQGFAKVTITHDWAKGVATLRSLTSIWTYYKLV